MVAMLPALSWGGLRGLSPSYSPGNPDLRFAQARLGGHAVGGVAEWIVGAGGGGEGRIEEGRGRVGGGGWEVRGRVGSAAGFHQLAHDDGGEGAAGEGEGDGDVGAVVVGAGGDVGVGDGHAEGAA